MEKCADCAYFAKFPPEEPPPKINGLCQRFPQPVEKNLLSWCGEFKFKGVPVCDRCKKPPQECRCKWGVFDD